MADGYRIDLGGQGSCVCYDGESVLLAMNRTGLKGLCRGCRQGGCGVCRVRVTAGSYRLGKMGRNHVSAEEEAEGIALACRIYPQSDLSMVVAPRPRPAKAVSVMTALAAPAATLLSAPSADLPPALPSAAFTTAGNTSSGSAAPV